MPFPGRDALVRKPLSLRYYYKANTPQNPRIEDYIDGAGYLVPQVKIPGFKSIGMTTLPAMQM